MFTDACNNSARVCLVGNPRASLVDDHFIAPSWFSALALTEPDAEPACSVSQHGPEPDAEEELVAVD